MFKYFKVQLLLVAVFLFFTHLISFSQSKDSLDLKDIKQKELLQKVDTLSHNNVQDSLVLDSLKKVLLADTLSPIKNYYSNNSFSDYSITSEDFLMGNPLGIFSQLSELPNTFYKDLGSPSNFSELFFAGNGLRRTSTSLNSRNILEPLTNSINLLDINYEEAQSIDIMISPRAFLYGSLNEPASIRINTKDFYSKVPFSRLKYLDAPYDNLFLDGLFNVFLFKRLNFEFGITKNSTKGRYHNSEYDIWKGRVKFAYFPSNKLNILFTYRFSQTLNQFNEGVNINAIVLGANQTINDVLYNELQAPVVNTSANQKNVKNNFDLEFRGDLLNDSLSKSFLNFYFLENSREYSSSNTSNVHYSKRLGSTFRQYLNLSLVEVEFISNLEKIFIRSPFVPYIERTSFSASLLTELKLVNNIRPVFYTKYFKLKEFSGLNFGGDITAKINNNLNLYFGASLYSVLPSMDEDFYQLNKYDYSNTLHLYSKVGFNVEHFSLNIDGYYLKSTLKNFMRVNNFSSLIYDSTFGIILTASERSEMFGFSLSGSLNIWKIHLGFTNSFISKKQIDNVEYKLFDQPEYSLNLSLMYKDILFKESLELSAGFKFNFFTQYNGYTFAPEKIFFVNVKKIDSTMINFSNVKINSNYKLDFILSGKIKQVATIYFAIENITNNKYYLTPYYPVNDFGLTFGIAWEFLD